MAYADQTGIVPPGTQVAATAITFPGSLGFAGAIEALAPALNVIGGVRYFCDSAGNIWLYVDANGVAHFPIGLTLDMVVFNQGIAVGDVTLKSVSAAGLISSRGTTDAAGNVSLLFQPDGSILAPLGVKGKYLAQASVDSDGMVYYSKLDGVTGFLQIFKSDPVSGTTWQLTSTGNNYGPQVSSDGTRLAFISDRTGTEQVFIGDLWAYVKVLSTQNLRALFQINHFCVTGQSLSNGFSAIALTTAAQPQGNLMFNGGARVVPNGASTVVPPGNMTSLVPLVEATVTDVTGGNPDGETISSGMVNRITQDMTPQGILFQSLASVSGLGGAAYSAIKKGTVIYGNTLAEVTAAAALAAAAGSSYGVRAVALIHGEADQIAGTTIYDQFLAQMQKNLNDDIRALTGQSTDIPLLFCQISEWTAPAGGNVAIGTIPYMQLAAHEAAPGKCILVGPKYHLPYGATPHLSADGYRHHGEYYGKVAERVIGQGKPWRPLSPRSIQRAGSQIMVTFWVPVQPLVIDTVNVVPPTYNPSGLNGFEYFDNSGSPPAITAVTVVSPTSVLITLASAPTGSGNRLRYAYTGVLGSYANGTPGASGPRGCLRDSDNSTSVYGYQMYNWCVHFDKPC